MAVQGDSLASGLVFLSFWSLRVPWEGEAHAFPLPASVLAMLGVPMGSGASWLLCVCGSGTVKVFLTSIFSSLGQRTAV